MPDKKEKIDLIRMNSGETLSYEDRFLNVLGRIILPSIIVSILITGFFSVRRYLNYVPQYRAISTILIDSNAPGSNEKDYYRRFQDAAYAYSDLLKTSIVTDNIATKDVNGLSSKDIKNVIIAQAKPTSQMVDIIVTTDNDELSRKVATASAQSLKEVSNKVFGEDLVTVVNVPTESSVTNSKFSIIDFIKTFLKYLAIIFTTSLIFVSLLTIRKPKVRK